MNEWRHQSMDWNETEDLEELEELITLLGHRNWLLLTDMAFPLLSAPGVQTVSSDVELLAALDFVLELLGDQPHVRPIAWLDAELDFVQEEWAPGISHFRQELLERLRGFPIYRLPHEQLIAKVSEAAQQFQVSVVKTRTCLPYTSVFLELDCAYWDVERERKLREAMGLEH